MHGAMYGLYSTRCGCWQELARADAFCCMLAASAWPMAHSRPGMPHTDTVGHAYSCACSAWRHHVAIASTPVLLLWQLQASRRRVCCDLEQQHVHQLYTPHQLARGVSKGRLHVRVLHEHEGGGRVQHAVPACGTRIRHDTLTLTCSKHQLLKENGICR